MKSNFEKIAILVLFGVLIASLAAAYLAYLGYNNTQLIIPQLNNLRSMIAANTQTIAASTGLG